MKRLRQAAATLTLAALAAAAIVQHASFAAPAQAKPFLPETWNTLERDNGNGSVTQEIHLKWINYNDGQEWKKIDITPIVTAKGAYINAAPYALTMPKFADGNTEFVATNKYDRKTNTVRDDPPVSKTKKWLDASHVPGVVINGEMVYAGALPYGDIILQPHEQEFRSIVRINSSPAGTSDLSIPFSEQYSDGLQVKTTKNSAITSREKDVGSGFGAKANAFRGIGTKVARAWDSDGHTIEIQVLCKTTTDDSTVRCRKIIPRSFLNDPTTVYPVYTDTTSTFFPDPETEVTSVDGSVTNAPAGQTWATVHDAADGTSIDDSSATDEAYVRKTDFRIRRSFLLFDTSTLPDSIAISAATIDLYMTAVDDNDNDGNDYITIVGAASPASNTAIVTADYDQAGAVSNPTKMSQDIDLTAGITTGQYNTFTLNAAGKSNISVTGVSKFSLREGHDQANDAIAVDAGNGVQYITSEQALTTQDPKLTVTFTAVAVPNIPSMLILE